MAWGDGPADWQGATVGAWWCDAEAARAGGSFGALELMAETGRYDVVGCLALAAAEPDRRQRLDR